MAKWLQSGMRRDMCAILAGGDRQAQALKARLSDHYDERIDPKTFYAALEALVDAGFVTAETDGIHDVYALTAAGRRRLEAHHEWVGSHLA